MTYLLQTHHLCKRIQGKELVKDINIHVKKGGIYGFLGPNGAGKTTVMKWITNLWKPTEGTISLFGKTLGPSSYEVLKRMGSIIEFPMFYEHMSGKENLQLHCEYMGYYSKGSVEEALELLHLTEAADQPVKRYSLGMKQRLGIARAILCKPEFVILDEPANGLDPAGVLDAAPGGDTISAPIELFTSMAFLVYTSVMLAAFIVSAYKNKTMNLMFTYPIKRQKILISQMLAVWLFNFAALLLTRLAIYLCVYLEAQSMQSAFAIDFDMGNAAFYLRLVLNSVEIVSMSFIALFVGMAWRSSKAAIVTSFLLIFLTQANVGEFTMADSVVFPVVLTGISIGFAVLAVWNVEKKDLL